MFVLPGMTPQSQACPRIAVGIPRDDKLYFAQVREDPLLEVEMMAPRPEGRYVVVSSGGCTALSLLARGAGAVASVDQNRTQNHMVELKAAAACLQAHGGPPGRALAFLGGSPASAETRLSDYREIRELLSQPAQAYWDRRRKAITAGVLSSGVTERFLKAIVTAVRLFIHRGNRMDRLLACRTLEEQARFYDEVWDTRGWRFLFQLLLNRKVFNRTYHPAFFRKVENPSFSRHFRGLFEKTVKGMPVRGNYFLHHMITGYYPHNVPGGLPPYLEDAGLETLAKGRNRLMLVDGTVTGYLRTLPPDSQDGFCLSNILEWHDSDQLNDLLSEIVRTAKPGAVLALRNFVGWTDIPEAFADRIVLDPASEALIDKDRSLVQSRFAACRIRKAA